MKPLVSVIVAVYNAETTLRRCLDSVVAQTLQNLEVILVDDGSHDASGKICDEYASNDSRVKVFHKANGGVSSARQFGIDHSSGNYTIHVDSDDWIDCEMLEQLYQCAIDNGADVVFTNFKLVKSSGDVVEYVNEPTGYEPDQVLRQMLNGKLPFSIWMKLIKRDLYEKFHIRFPEGLNYGEDAVVSCSIYRHQVKTSYLPGVYYNYHVSDSGSLTRKQDPAIVEKHRQKIELLFDGLDINLYKSEYLYQLMHLLHIALHYNVKATYFYSLFDPSMKEELSACVKGRYPYNKYFRQALLLAIGGRYGLAHHLIKSYYFMKRI